MKGSAAEAELVLVVLGMLNSRSFQTVGLKKNNAHKLTVKGARGASNGRYERDRIRVTITHISTCACCPQQPH